MFELVVQGIPVNRGTQEEKVSYIASMRFGDVVRLLDGGYLYVPNQPDLPDFAQRKLNSKRVKAIAEYILENYQEGTIFFPPICVNVQPVPTYKNGSIFLPYHSVTMRLTDGQHRCFGIRQALKEIKAQDSMEFPILTQLEVGVLLYSALSLAEERQAFRDQNLLVQRPSVSLSHYFDKRSPAVLIAKNLLEQVPKFQDNIEMVENSLGKHNSKLMTLSTLVRATQYMFPHLKSRKERDWQLEMKWATAFWSTTASILPDNPWEIKSLEKRRQQRQESLAVSAVVFQSLGMLAYDLYQEAVPADDF